MTATTKTNKPETKTNKPETKTNKPETTQPVIKIDINSIINAIPDTFTPATLDRAFNLNDGGKTVRRHLRKHFADELQHTLKNKWVFDKNNTAILMYFAERYTFDANALKTK